MRRGRIPRRERWRLGRRAALAGALVAASVFLVAPPASADLVRDAQYWLGEYGIEEAWLTTRGAGVTVSVIDTGVDGTHQDLAGVVVGGQDFSGVGGANGQTPIGEGPAHGTLVGSLIAGRGHGAGDGVIGVAPQATLLSASVGFGVGTTGSDEQIAEAVRWSVDNGADVINMSLTRNTLDWPQSWDDAFLYAMENDVVIVAAAGNRGSGTTVVGAPATMPGVLTVAGVDQNGRASFDASSQGITISVSAPSEGLVGAAPGNEYFGWAGTSGAAPLVSGIVALVRAANPELSANDVINRVIGTARSPGVAVPSPIYGFGLVDAAAAVNTVLPAVDTNPMGDLADWVRVNRRAAAPSPEPTVVPEETEGEELPPPSDAAGTANPIGTLLPTVGLLRDVGIPLAVFAGFGVLVITAIVGAARQYRRLSK